MKVLPTSEMRGMTIGEINKKVSELGRDLIKDRIFLREGKLKDTGVLKKERRNLARILTVLREKEYLKNISQEVRK